MPRRIDIELTSALSDGSWTWRAAGARVPKGVLDGSILPGGAAVGDELKVEIEQELDGIEVTSVVRGRDKASPDLLELLPVEENFQAVIETRAKRGRNDRGDREDRGRGGRDGKRGRRDDRSGGRGGRGEDRSEGRRRDRNDRSSDKRDGENRGGERRRGPRRPHFDPPPEVPKRPKPKRLRPGKARRNEVLASIPEEQRPIAELAIQGMAAVRTRLRDDNQKLAAEGKPTMPQDSVLKMAEGLIPKLRVADWLDRAEAAQRQMENLDLRDLRSVVAAGDDPIVARDESTREISEQLKADLVKKQEQELKLWLDDIDAAISVGRSIRALRLSSQPPKAGVMFPPEMARKLSEAATSGLTPDDPPDRWAAVMEAAAFSPVRTLVVPAAPPSAITDDLKKTALRLGPLLPQIAALLGVDVPADAPRPKPLRPGPRKDAKQKKSAATRDDARGANREDRKSKRKKAAAEVDGAKAESPKPDAPNPDAPKPESAKPESAETEVAKRDSPKPESAKPESAETEVAKADVGNAVPQTTEPVTTEPAKPDDEQIDAETPGSKNDAPTADPPAEALTADTREDSSNRDVPAGSGGETTRTPSTDDATPDAPERMRDESTAEQAEPDVPTPDIDQIDAETPGDAADEPTADPPADPPADTLSAEADDDSTS